MIKSLTDEIVAEAYKRHCQGERLDTISESYGINKSTLYKRFQAAGLAVHRYKKKAEVHKAGEPTGQKCWTCKHACPNYDRSIGCSWSIKGVPVEGWTARQVDRWNTNGFGHYKVETYDIKDCPQYEMDEHTAHLIAKAERNAREKAEYLAKIEKKPKQKRPKRVVRYTGGNNIQLYRYMKNLKQQELADLVHVSKEVIHSYETRETALIDPKVLKDIAEALNADIRTILHQPTPEEVKAAYAVHC